LEVTALTPRTAADTVIVSLARGDGPVRMGEAQKLLGAVDPVVLTPGQLADGHRNVFRGRRFRRLALVGSPPGEELGYSLASVLALARRPKEVALVDVDRGEVQAFPLLRYLAASTPFAVAQLTTSAALLGAQRAAMLWVARQRRVPPARHDLRKLVYLRPGTGAAVGGAVTHTHEVIRALVADGVEIDAFTTSAAIAKTALRDPVPPCRWRVVRPPRLSRAVSASAVIGGDAALVRAALGAAREADAVYQRHARFSLAGAIVAGLAKKPLILEFNGSEVFFTRHWDRNTRLSGRVEASEDAVLASASRIVVVSDVDARSLVQRGIDEQRIVVNPNGVDGGRFAIGGGAATRRRHRIDADDVVIGFVGSFGPWHGAPVLARAFVGVAEHVPDARLLLVGDGRELDTTMSIVREAGLRERATATGLVPPSSIPAYLDACDILVAPHVPLPEGMEFFGSPTKLFEYMAAGKAIVASRSGQIGEVLEDRVTGLLVQPGDVFELQEAVISLAASPETRSSLGARARQRALECHGWRLNAKRLLDAYADLAEEIA
jgi:glycosyltransferase involved in cell wall biosynthesis